MSSKDSNGHGHGHADGTRTRVSRSRGGWDFWTSSLPVLFLIVIALMTGSIEPDWDFWASVVPLIFLIAALGTALAAAWFGG